MIDPKTETPSPMASGPETLNWESQRIEFDLLLEEYKMVNARLTRELDMEEKGFEFLFIAIGGTVVAMTFVLQQNAYFLMLLLALPFHLLTWKQARRIIWTAQLVSYIRQVLAPRLNAIVQGVASKQKVAGKTLVFKSWEEYALSYLESRTMFTLTMAFPHAGQSFLHLGAAISLVVAYYLLRANTPQYLASGFDTGLIAVNYASLAASVVLLSISIIVRLSLTRPAAK